MREAKATVIFSLVTHVSRPRQTACQPRGLRSHPALRAHALCELTLTNKELHGTQDAKKFFPPFGN